MSLMLAIFHREPAFDIPATTERSAARGTRTGKVVIQTSNVEADKYGFVHLADRANTGRPRGGPTGGAAKIAGRC